jgi:hypothetical protein
MKPSEILKSLLVEVPDKQEGICGNFRKLNEEYLNVYLREYNINYEDWSLYSGNSNYPVQGELGTAFTSYHYSDNKWDKSTKYGKQRYELLNWLIEQFEAKGA